MTTKEKLLICINKVQPLDDYEIDDVIFSIKYRLSATDIVYIILELAKTFSFVINDDFIDALEMCTFSKLEELLEQYDGTM